MALTNDDKREIAELFNELQARDRITRVAADDIIPLIQAPNLRITPGPTRSRYSQVTLMDKDDHPRWQMRVRTSDLRTILLSSYNDEPGVEVEDGASPAPITGPRG